LDAETARRHNDAGCALLDQLKIPAAIEQFRQALRLRSDFPEARMNLALALLTLGEFEEGWRHFEYPRTGPARHVGQVWSGEDLAGKTILLWAEGGLGNVIQFARYATLVAALGGKVILECQPALKRLLATVPGISQVINCPLAGGAGKGETPPPFHFHAPLTRLPRIFGTTLQNVPAQVPYVSADPTLVKHWGREMKRIKGLKVGIVWEAEQATWYGRQRSIPLEHFAALASVPGVSLVCLQKGFSGPTCGARSRTATFPLTILADLDGSRGAFMDTAAVMQHLDLVITADTSTAHLAGALGVPAWVALRTPGDWRWMLDREDSPWYPTLRLFRQRRRDDWQGVFERMAAELAGRVA